MDAKKKFHMQDHTAYSGVFDLTDTEAEQLRARGWLVVPIECVDDERQGHLHLMDPDGKFVGSRVLDRIQAGDFIRRGYHLVHVGDATFKEIQELRKEK